MRILTKKNSQRLAIIREEVASQMMVENKEYYLDMACCDGRLANTLRDWGGLFVLEQLVINGNTKNSRLNRGFR